MRKNEINSNKIDNEKSEKIEIKINENKKTNKKQIQNE